MVKGLLFGLVVWGLVTGGLYGFGHLTKSAKLGVARSAVFGLITAVIAVAVVVGIVIAF